MTQPNEQEPLHRNPAIAAGQILNTAGYPIDVAKIFEFADWCEEPVPEISLDMEFPSRIIRINKPQTLNYYRWPGKARKACRNLQRVN